MLEITGVILLSLTLLSLDDYFTLPAPLNSPLAYMVTIFLDVLLVLPTAVVLIWCVAQLLAPQLISRALDDSTDSDKDERDGSSH